MRMRYHIIRLLLMTFIIGCTGCQRKVREEPVVFQDSVFQAAFERQLYVENVESVPFVDTNPPTQSQLNRMTSLSLFFHRGEDCSLEDLKKFPNLRGLAIRNASQSVIQQVSGQEQLKVLAIEVHDPVDMSPIGAMHNVIVLDIAAYKEEAGKFDWSFIGEMEQLETIYIRYINLNNLDFLKSLPNLKRIIIDKTEIGDITALETLSNLKYFSISDSSNDYSDVLKNMNHLEQLSISDFKITDWNFLKDKRDLNRLLIYGMGNVKLPEWLLPENYPYLSVLHVDDDILNTNRELLAQIMPVLEEREKEKPSESQFYDPRYNFLPVLERMNPLEIYDD